MRPLVLALAAAAFIAAPAVGHAQTFPSKP